MIGTYAKRAAVVAALSIAFTSHAEQQPFGKPTLDIICKRNSLNKLDTCRSVRDGKHSKVWSIHVSGRTPVPIAICDGEEFEPDPLELAKEMCNRTNTTRKKDLKECFEEGIGIKTNFDVDKACPKGDMVDVLPPEADPICDQGDPKVQKDGGNGWFGTCTATGPGPAGQPNENWTPWNHNGCCLVGQVKHDKRGFELKRLQGMTWDKYNDEDWTEDYFAETATHEVYMCNSSTTPQGQQYIHYYCAQTSQDLMVEGWQNPEENPDHQGPGWCNVTTGAYVSGGTTAVEQIFGDLAKAIQYIGEPKGIVDPTFDPRYDENNPHERFMCKVRRDRFDTHCSDQEIVSTNQFAHSMGSIAAAVWGLPFDYFGGGATGAPAADVQNHGRPGQIRNNCDPVPQIVDYMHPYAIYFYAKQHMNTPTGGVGNYRWCNDRDINSDCVRRDASYVGRPAGPDGCGVNGTTCEYAAWCRWDPYNRWRQDESGRQQFAPSECPNAAGEIIDEVRRCLEEDDGLTKILTCLDAAYDTVDLVKKFPRAVEDHAFDDYNNWGGYRVLTRWNWDVPRTNTLGSVQVPPPPPPPGGGCDEEPPPGSPVDPVCVEEEM